MNGRENVNGIDEAKVTAWLAANVDGLAAPYTFELISGGLSNLTFAVTDATGRRVVLRRPPISHVLASAHDMGREYRIISALQSTDVPVPEALGFCADEAVNGRPFYVMGLVDGYIFRHSDQVEAVLDDDGRWTAGTDLIDVLAAIHEVDIDAVGLGDLGRREGYVERQLRRWYGQFQQSLVQEREAGIDRDVPLIHQAHEILSDRLPEQVGATLVHGDYRLDNTMIGADGRVAAVLDWELCTLGDAMADVGTFMMYWAEPTEVRPGEPGAASALAGFPSRAALAERYAKRSGRDISDLPYYVAFGHWKLACIMEGVYARYATGAMGSDAAGSDRFIAQVESHAEDAWEGLQASR